MGLVFTAADVGPDLAAGPEGGVQGPVGVVAGHGEVVAGVADCDDLAVGLQSHRMSPVVDPIDVVAEVGGDLAVVAEGRVEVTSAHLGGGCGRSFVNESDPNRDQRDGQKRREAAS